jgi:hypothetical protein
MASWPKTETELAAPLVAYLRDMGWTVYQEVKVKGPRADIVAVRGQLVYVIECKLSLSLAVLDQAANWLWQANYVSVAVPYRRSPGRAAQTVLNTWGVGCCTISQPIRPEYGGISFITKPKLNRKACPQTLLGCLSDKQQDYAEAGNADGKFWSPFNETCENVRRYVTNHPGCSIGDVIKGLDKHHYAGDSTAKSSLLAWAKLGKLRGVEARADGKRWQLFVKEGAS